MQRRACTGVPPYALLLTALASTLDWLRGANALLPGPLSEEQLLADERRFEAEHGDASAAFTAVSRGDAGEFQGPAPLSDLKELAVAAAPPADVAPVVSPSPSPRESYVDGLVVRPSLGVRDLGFEPQLAPGKVQGQTRQSPTRKLRPAARMGRRVHARPIAGDGLQRARFMSHMSDTNQPNNDIMVGSDGSGKFPPQNLFCIRRSGISCTHSSQKQNFASMMGGSCATNTEGPSYCVNNECVCDRGFCADSKGKCVPTRNELVKGSFTISTAKYPKSFVAMGISQDGTPSVVIQGEGNAPNAQWVIIRRPDDTHLLTTKGTMDVVASFVETCTSTDLMAECDVRVQPVKITRGNDVSLEIRKFGFVPGAQSNILTSPRSDDIMYFDLMSHNYAMGCQNKGGDSCPGDSGYLIFNPPLPSNLNLRTQPSLLIWQIFKFTLLIVFAFLLTFFFWFECCLHAKGTRF